MSDDLISRYKNSYRIQFLDADIEARYRDGQQQRGQDSSLPAFAALLLLSLAFAYLEFRAFGHDVPIPMYGYLLAVVVALGNLLISYYSEEPLHLQLRLIANGLLAMGTVIGAVFLQKYSAYHALEFGLLLVWMGSLGALSVRLTLSLNLLLSITFVAVMYLTAISAFWISLVSVLLGSAVLLGGCLGYISERIRRMLFLQAEANRNMTSRQEMWAFTLVDMDLALGGILDFRELILKLKKHIEPVIEFDSYVMTSLEGQGPKPVPDQIEGALFENDDRTLWTEELVGKLSQTRQATVSAEHEMVKGFMGKENKRFISYRLDIPVFNDSRLVGIISLRRASRPFDSLDMIASVSITGQAMLIFERSKRTHKMVPEKVVTDAIIRPKLVADPQAVPVTPQAVPVSPISIPEDRDMEVTDQTYSEPDHTLVPREVITKFKQEHDSAKKTITLMSRENAEKIAVDRYRTAAVEGEPLSVLIIEVDGLSKLREQDGDEVAYKVFAAIVKYVFSKVDNDKDILGRYGQNGLSVLMPKVDMNAAERFAEMIRQFVSSARYKTAYGEKTTTLSIGVAAMTDDTGNYSSMVKRADMALFVAKKNGRNCVKVRL